MASRSAGQGPGSRAKVSEPSPPDLPAVLTPATLPGDALADGAVHLCLAFEGTDLSGSQAAGAEIDQCRYRDVSLGASRLRRAVIRDAAFDRCDLANLQARESSMLRVAVTASRMTGLSWLDGKLRDVTLTGCRIDLASFRQTAFRDVVFTDCRMEQADFGDADLTGARFDGCDLTGAQFSGARMTGTRLTRCDLTGMGGVTSLRGAIVTSADAQSLAFALAGALGIVINDA